MIETYLPHLDSIAKDLPGMTSLLAFWANINSGSENLGGLDKMLSALQSAFARLGGEMQSISLPPRHSINAKGELISIPVGNALHLRKHPRAAIQVFLGGHMDTVFPASSPFQNVQMAGNRKMIGPGVVDMKGGLIIMLKALEALEASPWAGRIGWEVLINPDEEVGSGGSEGLLREAAKRNALGLLFEPSFPDGCLVSQRKGSAKFIAVARGRAAHVGRDFHSGRSAIAALCKFIVEADALNDKSKGITLNFGQIEGGGPVNIVPDLAICRMDARMESGEEQQTLRKNLQNLAARCNGVEGITLILHEITSREPKPFDTKAMQLFERMKTCAEKLSIDLQWRPTGGVCDGNILASSGLPNIDTLGAVGGKMHTMEEYIDLDSMPERARLAALFLMMLASGQIDCPCKINEIGK